MATLHHACGGEVSILSIHHVHQNEGGVRDHGLRLVIIIITIVGLVSVDGLII